MTARFPKTYCSQCGGEFGPGNEGFGHCSDHKALALLQRYVDLDITSDKVRGNDILQTSGLHREAVALIRKATGATQ